MGNMYVCMYKEIGKYNPTSSTIAPIVLFKS